MPLRDARDRAGSTPAEQTFALIYLLGRAYNIQNRDKDVKGLATVEEIETALRRVAEGLNAAGLKWAVAGGFAVGIRAKPRATFDVDLIVLAKDFDPIKMAVARQWFDLSEERGEATLGRWEGVKCETLVGPFPSKVDVDILFSGLEFFESVLLRATVEELLPDLKAPVITAEDLILFKLKAERRQDIGDADRVFVQQGPKIDWAYLRLWAERIGASARLKEFEAEFAPKPPDKLP